MLSLDVCKRLNGAGLPQNCARFYYSTDAEFNYLAGFLHHGTYDIPRGRPALACPDSDELIAAISARWTDEWLHDIHPTRDIFYSPIEFYNFDTDDEAEFMARGDTLVEVLAELYIALADAH